MKISLSQPHGHGALVAVW